MEIVDKEATTQPEKIFDADHDKWIDNPALKKEEDSEQESEEEQEKPVKKIKDAKETKEEESEEETEEEEGEESEESEEEESEEGVEEEEETEDESEEKPAKKSKDEEEVVSPDDYIANTYGEKYGVKTESDLTKIVDNAIDLVDKHEALVKEHAALKAESGKPKFTSDKQQKAFEFISQFDIDRQGEALDTFAKLISMDVESADPVLLLEEQYVHQHPEWTRAESQRMFKKEYAKKYTLKRESFDGTDEEFKEEMEDRKIMEKGDIARAKNYLKEQKTKYKPAEKEQPRANEAIAKAVEKNAKEFAAYSPDEVVYQDGDDKFTYKLDADKKKQVSESMKAWVNNPASYNEKGDLAGVSTPEEMHNIIVGGMFMKDIVKALKSQVNNRVITKRVEELSTKTPKRRQVPGSGEAKTNKDDLDAQAMQLIKKRKAA